MSFQEENSLVEQEGNIYLQPIADENPCGVYLKLDPVYDEIMKARLADDPNLPMGEWQHDLKKADWGLVKKKSAEALLTRTKDLQLAIWLLEAEIHLNGFAGFAEGVILIADLADRFWDQIYPLAYEGDIEYRTNLFHWMNKKLQPVLKQIPLTRTNNQADYTWSDWEKSSAAETLPKSEERFPDEIARLATVHHAISLSPNQFFEDLNENISLGLSALGYLGEVLERRCGTEAPSISGLSELLNQIQTSLREQLKSRGLMKVQEVPLEEKQNSEDNSGEEIMTGRVQDIPDASDFIRSREHAYQCLSAAAEYLSREDAHSPVPYLIFKAIDWGRLNTTELYHELFVHHGGTLNIFDLVGLEEIKDNEDAQS